jgi:hypothetical protein
MLGKHSNFCLSVLKLCGGDCHVMVCGSSVNSHFQTFRPRVSANLHSLSRTVDAVLVEGGSE